MNPMKGDCPRCEVELEGGHCSGCGITYAAAKEEVLE